MAWSCLLLAGLLEIIWTLGLKYSDGFTRFWPSLVTLAASAASLALLSFSLKALPYGTAYAIWTGIGAVGTVLVGIFLFGESINAARMGCLALILGGIVGLRLVTPA
jgi:quaternary ammonium compound-resistance protein SugE